MASQTSSEAPQPSLDEVHLPQPQKSGSTDSQSLQSPSQIIVPNHNVDTKVNQGGQDAISDLVADDQAEEAQGAVKAHTVSLLELQDRLYGLEQRLRQAGLLEKPQGQSQSMATPEKKLSSETTKATAVTKSRSSRDETREKEELGQIQASQKAGDGSETSVQTLLDRINSLERGLEEGGRLKDKSATDKPRLPAIPQLHYVEWSEFKNKLAGEDQIYAIEVLIGGAKYYHQRSEEERKNKQKLKDRSNDPDQAIIDHRKSASLPERIRINSKPLILIMNQTDPTNRSENPIVMLRPFKPLMYHEVRIREVFQRLSEKWGTMDLEALTDRLGKHTVGKESGDSPGPAVLDEAIASISAESEDQDKGKTAPDRLPNSEHVIVMSPDATVTGRHSINSPSTAKPPQSSLPIANKSTEQSATMESEKSSPKAVSESKNPHKEETEDLTDSLEAFRDLRCLIELIDVELKPVADSYRDMTRQKIPFCDMWLLFKPGDLLYSPLGSKQASDNIYIDGRPYPQKPDDRFQEVFRICCTTGGRNHLEETNQNFSGLGHKGKINAFLVSTYWVDFNATRFTSRAFVFYMVPFSGERDITSLQCYPLRYVPKADEMKAKWKARGDAFREYTTFKYRYYTGKTLTCAPDGYHGSKDEYPKHAENIESQVVVDFSQALEAYPGWRTSGNNVTLGPEDAPGELSENYPTSYWKDSYRKILDEEIDDDIYDDDHIDIKLLEEYIEIDSLLRDHPQTSPAGNGALDENHLILLPNRVFAFVMKNRKWAILRLDGLRAVKRYDRGFKDLQLPIGHKRTISSLVKNHFDSRNADLDDLEASYDSDLVRGKGKGLVILLHGAPGVGKTSTAETVADAFGKILLPITCGDLGLTAAHVESELSEKFHLAELWDCVLLLDEADVFLARRTNNDIKRNSLVSVFLRMLEYFTGVLFLTTNRVGAFDEAFKSRIHISLYYPPLDEEKTRSIWKMNLERLSEKKQRRNEPIQFNEKDIFAYAKNHFAETFPRGANWNGRQIRNAFQTASALAEFEAQEKNKKLKARSLETGDGFVPVNPQLSVKHFEEIAWASYEFDKYISETKGLTEAEIAHMEGQRMDAFRSSRRQVRDREQLPTQIRESPARTSILNHRPRPKVGRTFDDEYRQINVRPPITFTYDATGDQGSLYDQPPTRREPRSINTSGARTGARIPQGDRPSMVSSRPKNVQRPGAVAGRDRERQRQVVFDQHEPQLEYEDEEEQEFEPPYEGSLPQPMSSYANFENTSQREMSPLRRQVGDFSEISRKPTVSAYIDDLEVEDDTYGR